MALEKKESLWRKPITLDVEDDTDPLVTLYRGREVADLVIKVETEPKTVEKKVNKPTKVAEAKVKREAIIKKTLVVERETVVASLENPEKVLKVKVLENDLKAVLRIKSETFNFTDIREILRGKSIEIYAYLLMLAGDKGVCKIKHLDMMRVLDISRPTLFKQGEWLTRLSLIVKSSVPGDHLGTSYAVNRLENTLPISESLIEQFNTYFEEFRQNIESKII